MLDTLEIPVTTLFTSLEIALVFHFNRRTFPYSRCKTTYLIVKLSMHHQNPAMDCVDQLKNGCHFQQRSIFL
jgi:hypothetical protein